jgi:hypothetical protein
MVDARGKWVIAPKFDRLRPFTGQLARAVSQGKTGFINRAGEWAIAPTWTLAADFALGLAPVADAREKWGLIDTAGQWRLAPVYDQLWYGGDSLWVVEKEGRYGAVDAAGQERIPLSFQQLQSFAEGYAAYQQDELWGYVHKSGQLLTSAEFGLAWHFESGMARVATRRGLTFIDTLGQIRFQPRYLDLRELKEGLIQVQVYR